MQNKPLPDEFEIRRTIAERLGELRALRAIERALARYRRERAKMADTTTQRVEQSEVSE